ncbi:MAG: phosphoribosylformylglycinamidine synthase subunit PurL [bacterium]
MAAIAEKSPSPKVPLRDMSVEELETFSEEQGLSLSGDDLKQIRDHFDDLGRDPTQVEVEVLAQTWSEHCKHRIFHGEIEHEVDGERTTVDGIFQQFIKRVTDRVSDEKPGFVLTAFDDNAGFIKLDEETGACMKVETHNHPSAIEPYAGANTGIGGVIRDILGAGLGARPIGSVDVFCLGHPDTSHEELPESVIPPRGIFKGVVQGVRDYGNRMGIPTCAGAITFHENYTYNPLVFCGTVGTIPSDEIEKSVKPGLDIVTAGGLTGRDGLHGATFSSDTLSGESHEEDQSSVQIGNPIEEKKVLDFVLEARRQGLIETITDCGAGGFSSAVGEMVEDTGGEVYLEDVPLKEEGLDPWEIFLSESQERMVLAVDPADLEDLKELADVYGTNCHKIAESTDSNRLKVYYEDDIVCDLDCEFLHSPPRLTIESKYDYDINEGTNSLSLENPGETLKDVIGHINLASRSPVIREYDHEVQGNTVQPPLAGPEGDAPSDGVVLRVDGSDRLLSTGLALLPRYGYHHPRKMGRVTVDEAIRQVVASGADPDRIGILDNFSMGDPEIPENLGVLVETARGMSEAAETFAAPFISGKDSFYNSYETESGEMISVPMTLVVSALGVVEDTDDVLGTSVLSSDSSLCILGATERGLTGSALGEAVDIDGGQVPDVDPDSALRRYQGFYHCVSEGLINAAHDVSEGGLAVTLAEMGFGNRAGLSVDLSAVPAEGGLTPEEVLFSESGGRIVFEVESSDLDAVRDKLSGHAFSVIGETTDQHGRLTVTNEYGAIVNEPLRGIKERWQTGLEPYY